MMKKTLGFILILTGFFAAFTFMMAKKPNLMEMEAKKPSLTDRVAPELNCTPSMPISRGACYIRFENKSWEIPCDQM